MEARMESIINKKWGAIPTYYDIFTNLSKEQNQVLPNK